MSDQELRDQIPPTVPVEPDPVDEVIPAPTSEPVDVPRSRPRRPVNLDGIVWAAILIWSGLVLIANNLGLLGALGLRRFALSWELPLQPVVWTLIFLGVALLVGLEIAIRLAVPVYRRNVLGYVVLTIVSLSLGLGRLALMWPLILIALGAALLLRRSR